MRDNGQIYSRAEVVEILRQNQQRYQLSQHKLAALPSGSRDHKVREILMIAQARTVFTLQLHLQTHDWENER